MSAIETSEGRTQDVVRPVATITTLPRATPDLAPLPIPTLAQVGDLICPPDLWSDDRPSLRKVWLYGVYGRWTAADGFVRFAGAAYATVIAMPVTTVLYLVQWIFERPARLLVAAIVAGLVKLVL